MNAYAKPLPIDIEQTNRQKVYERLQQLEIPCSWGDGEPLQVRVENPVAALQVWSVLQQYAPSDAAVRQRLKRCWQMFGYGCRG